MSFRPSRIMSEFLLRRIKCPDHGFIYSCVSSPVNLVLASYLISTLIADYQLFICFVVLLGSWSISAGYAWKLIHNSPYFISLLSLIQVLNFFNGIISSFLFLP